MGVNYINDGNFSTLQILILTIPLQFEVTIDQSNEIDNC
jgi:hypothetical protein